MDNNKIYETIALVKDKIPEDKIPLLTKALENADENTFIKISALPLKSKTTTLLLSIFLGGLGADRFYLGDTGVGIAKLLLGWLTFGIWPLIDIFVCYKRCKELNYQNIVALA